MQTAKLKNKGSVSLLENSDKVIKGSVFFIFGLLLFGFCNTIYAGQIINMDNKVEINRLIDEASVLLEKTTSRVQQNLIAKADSEKRIITKKYLLNNAEKAIVLYKKAYKLGSGTAARLAGVIYGTILQDKNKAIVWLNKAIQKNEIKSFSILALLSKDFKKQMYYLKEGLKKGDQGSAHFLANMYYSIKDIEKFNTIYWRFITICRNVKKECDEKIEQHMQKMYNKLNKEK